MLLKGNARKPEPNSVALFWLRGLIRHGQNTSATTTVLSMLPPAWLTRLNSLYCSETVMMPEAVPVVAVVIADRLKRKDHNTAHITHNTHGGIKGT